MNDICAQLILKQNPNLNKQDLLMLNMLSDEYDVLSVSPLLLKYYAGIESIISSLIVNKLPYYKAIELLEKYKDEEAIVFLPRKIVSVKDLKIEAKALYKNDILIQNEVAKMNSLIEYKRIRKNEEA